MANNPIMVPMTVASDSEALAMSVGVSIGGGSAILGTKEITNNGVYNAAADGYDGYSSVDVQVAGGSATLGEKSVTANGVYNASSDSLDGYSKVTVSVPASAVDSGTKSITANGNNQDVVGYAAVNVNVPNSYSAGDEGKVVSNGALVAQTAHADVTPTTSDQTIDTTTNNSLKVKGDADLVASNIKKDVEIFGVTGSYEGGGGGVTAATGEVTIASDVSSPGTTASKVFPGIQLSFQPDFFWISKTRASFEDENVTSNGAAVLVGIKKTLMPPYRTSATSWSDSNSNDYLFLQVQGGQAPTFVDGEIDPSVNYGIGVISSLSQSPLTNEGVGTWSVNANGTFSYGRATNTTQVTLKAGAKYRYFAVKI